MLGEMWTRGGEDLYLFCGRKGSRSDQIPPEIMEGRTVDTDRICFQNNTLTRTTQCNSTKGGTHAMRQYWKETRSGFTLH